MSRLAFERQFLDMIDGATAREIKKRKLARLSAQIEDYVNLSLLAVAAKAGAEAAWSVDWSGEVAKAVSRYARYIDEIGRKYNRQEARA